MGGKPDKPKQSKTQLDIEKQTLAINQRTLDRLDKEEAKIASDESERQRLLEGGRFGRTSLLTGGFLGPGSTSTVSRAQTRANERGKTRSSGRGGRRRGSSAAASGVRGPGSSGSSGVARRSGGGK